VDVSDRICQSISLPQDYHAQPATIAAAVAAALTDLEDKAKTRGLRPIWDTVEIATESDEIDSSTFAAPNTVRITTGEVSVLAVDPKEVSE
jgi:hypothetical protein